MKWMFIGRWALPDRGAGEGAEGSRLRLLSPSAESEDQTDAIPAR